MVKKFAYFIGVDVSRNELDFAVMEGKTLLFHREIVNEPDNIKQFLSELKQLPKFTIGKTLFGMEQTGLYNNHLIKCLKRLKGNFVTENPLHMKLSFGNVRGKHDKIDAIRIAQYIYKNRDDITIKVTKRPVVENLANLATVRERLLSISNALKTPLKEHSKFSEKKTYNQLAGLCKATITTLKDDLINVEKLIEETISNDDSIKSLHKIITSIPSIGPVTALQVIIVTNEFKNITSPKQFACYSGVAPFKNESGLRTSKAKVSSFANKKMKALLHICAMNVIRYQPELRAYYLRKTEVEGKNKMLVLNAIRNKLILRIFACVKQNRPYNLNYKQLSAN